MEDMIFDAVSELRQSFDKSKLKINTEKTQLIEFAYSTDFLSTTYIRESEAYKTSKGVCFLGVHVDYRVSWRDHIDKVAGSMTRYVYALRTLADTVSQGATFMAYHAFTRRADRV
ncbi:hypothetical protein HHI36_009146, partial [Cryptolaemus montrouzieri]